MRMRFDLLHVTRDKIPQHSTQSRASAQLLQRACLLPLSCDSYCRTFCFASLPVGKRSARNGMSVTQPTNDVHVLSSCHTRDWPFPNGGNGKDQGGRRYARAVIRNSSRRCVTVSLNGWGEGRGGEVPVGGL